MQYSFPLCDPAVSGLHRKNTGGQEHKDISSFLYTNILSSAYCKRFSIYCSLLAPFQLGRNVLTLSVSQEPPIQHLPPHPDSKVNTTFPTSLSYIISPKEAFITISIVDSSIHSVSRGQIQRPYQHTGLLVGDLSDSIRNTFSSLFPCSMIKEIQRRSGCSSYSKQSCFLIVSRAQASTSHLSLSYLPSQILIPRSVLTSRFLSTSHKFSHSLSLPIQFFFRAQKATNTASCFSTKPFSYH